jgi:hypothetical protein
MTHTGTPVGDRSLADAKRDLLARLLQAEGVGVADSAIPRQTGERGPQSFAQELLWMLDRAAPGLTAYNAPVARRLHGAFDPRALQSALDAVAARHEALRTVYETVDGRALQHILPAARVPLALVDLRGRPAAEREAGPCSRCAPRRPMRSTWRESRSSARPSSRSPTTSTSCSCCRITSRWTAGRYGC